MITIQAYRVCIGSFAFSAHRNVSSIAKSINIGSYITTDSFAKLLKPVRIVVFLMLIFFAIPMSYEVTFVQTPLEFLHLSRYGTIFVKYPNMSYNLGEPSLIFLEVDYTLLLSGDIELNPGPRTEENQDSIPQPSLKIFKKIVLGNFNQGQVLINRVPLILFFHYAGHWLEI